MKYISRDSIPEQLHGWSLAIGGIDARTAQLKNFSLMGDKWPDVVFVGRVEAAKAACGIPPKQAVGSYDRAAAPAMSAVEDEKVIAVVIKAVEIALSTRHLRQRPRS